MTSNVLVSGLVLASALFSAAAMADTGRPSEAPASIARSDVIDTSQDPAGSYAHYRMLNGATRDEALREAQAIDHPAPRKFRFAWQHVRADKATPAQAPSN